MYTCTHAHELETRSEPIHLYEMCFEIRNELISGYFLGRGRIWEEGGCGRGKIRSAWGYLFRTSFTWVFPGEGVIRQVHSLSRISCSSTTPGSGAPQRRRAPRLAPRPGNTYFLGRGESGERVILVCRGRLISSFMIRSVWGYLFRASSSFHTIEWVMSFIQMIHATRTNKSCHVHQYDMSHLRISHVIHFE